MDDVDIHAIDRGQELGEAIELALEPTPVVLPLPRVDQCSGLLGADALRSIRDGLRIRPSGSRESLLQVIDL